MKKAYVGTVLMCTIILAGCSYNRFEDSVREQWESGDTSAGKTTTEEQAVSADTNSQTDTNLESQQEESTGAESVQKEKTKVKELPNVYAADPLVHGFSEAVKSEYTGMQYQIKALDIFDGFQDSGLDIKEVQPSDWTIPYLTDKTTSRFVVLTIFAERVGQHIAGEAIIPKINSQKIINGEAYNPPDSYTGFDVAYFSGHPQAFDEDNYSDINLEIGASAEYKIGYFVPEEVVESGNMIWCIDFTTDRQKYIALEESPSGENDKN